MLAYVRSTVVDLFHSVVDKQHEPILNLEDYTGLDELFRSKDRLKYLEIMARLYRNHHADLARVLVNLFGYYGEIVPLIKEATEKVISREGADYNNTNSTIYVLTSICTYIPVNVLF